MAMNQDDNNLGITSLIKQAEGIKAKPVVPKESSQGFVRVKYIKGRPYYYLVKSVRIAGKVKQKIIKYLGTRKPRGDSLSKIASGEKEPSL